MSVRVFNNLLTQEMTRKEFLLYLGFLLFAVTGISGLIKTLADPYLVPHTSQHNPKVETGFGSGPYGR